MMKILKIVGIAVAALLGLLVAAAVALALLFDPNQYRDDIIRLVKDKTGRELKIEKKISWSFFPRLGIEAGGLELGNAAGFGREPFARIEAAGAHVAVVPLFSGRIEVATVFLHGLGLNLAKNVAGQTNWDDLVKAFQSPEAKPAPAAKPGKLPLAGLQVGKIDIKRANLTWRDPAAGTLAVRDLELSTGRFVAGAPVALHLAFEFLRDRAEAVKFALDSRVTATADSLRLADLDLRLDDSRLKGSLEVRDFAHPAIAFDLTLDKIDLDRYLGGAKAQPALGAKPGAPAAAPAGPATAPHAALRALNLQGKLRIGELKVLGARASDAQVKLEARSGLLTLGPNTAKLYGGSYRGQTVVDARPAVAQLKLDEQLEGVAVGPLLKDMKLFERYSGTGDIVLKLTAQGLDEQAIRRSLNGNAHIAFRNGRIEGVDLAKLVQQARAVADVARGKPVPAKAAASDATVFRSLTASAQVTNGIARNEDLVLDGQNIRATGRGSADLVKEVIDYALKVTLTEDPARRGTSVPVKVSGPFRDPSYQVDLGEVAKEQLEKKLEKTLEKKLFRKK